MVTCEHSLDPEEHPEELDSDEFCSSVPSGSYADLLDFAERVGRHIDASPSPFHAVKRAVSLLTDVGARTATNAAEAASPGLWYSAADGTLTAWYISESHNARSGFRIVGAHTDSPNLQLKPRPNRYNVGYRQLGVEVYGGVLLNSWLDRDLGLAGRIAVRDGSAEGMHSRLVRIDDAILRVAQLAIHLDRGVNEKGLVLNKQEHLSPIWGLERARSKDFIAVVADAAGVEANDVIGHELMAFDLAPSRLVGDERSMLSAARIDNLVSCFIAVHALITVAGGDTGSGVSEGDVGHGETGGGDSGMPIPIVCLFDHEEVGSVSATGAASRRLNRRLELIAEGLGADTDDIAASRSDSLMLSADSGHATHPNYVERHDPDYLIRLNSGPVLKWNANQRYATDARTAAAFRLACDRAGVPVQYFVSRGDLACGSTIGPIAASRLGVGVVDAGCPQLAMHSARELCGSSDISWFNAAMTEFLRG